MTRIRLALFSFFLALLFAASSYAAAPALAAPRLYLDPVEITSTKNSQFEVKVQINVEDQSAFGADGFVHFTEGEVRLDSVTAGDFFSDFGYSTTSTQAELHGYFGSSFDSRSGAGTLATLKFTFLKDSGSSNITFVCTGSGNDTQILNISGNNILACGSLNQSTVTTTSSSSNPPPPPPPPPGSNNNNNSNQTTKACAGSCSTGYDCDAGLFCNQGVCRNPACKSDTDCKCSVATPKPSIKPKPKASSTPQAVALIPYVSPTPEPSVTPAPQVEQQTASPVDIEIIAIVVILITLLGGIFLLVRKLRNRNKPPYINLPGTPENTGQQTQTQQQNPTEPPSGVV